MTQNSTDNGNRLKYNPIIQQKAKDV